MFTEFVSDEDLERMARRRLSTLPTFAYAGGGEEALHRTTPEYHPTHGDLLVEEDAWMNELGGAVLIGAFAFLFASFLLLYFSSNLGKRSRGERTVSSRARATGDVARRLRPTLFIVIVSSSSRASVLRRRLDPHGEAVFRPGRQQRVRGRRHLRRLPHRGASSAREGRRVDARAAGIFAAARGGCQGSRGDIQRLRRRLSHVRPAADPRRRLQQARTVAFHAEHDPDDAAAGLEFLQGRLQEASGPSGAGAF